MKLMRRIVAVAAVMLSTACDSEPQRDDANDRGAVDRIRLEFEAGENAGDLDRMTRHLAADVVAMPPNRAITTGAASFTESLRGFLGAYKVDVKYKTDEMVVFGDWAMERGTAVETLTPKSGGAPETSNAKYLWLYHRNNGVWELARLMWNSSDPAAPPVPTQQPTQPR
jgi:ketosteroid isomerase-like protein